MFGDKGSIGVGGLVDKGASGASVVPDRKLGFWHRDDYESTGQILTGVAGGGVAQNNNSNAIEAGRPGQYLLQVAAVADRASLQWAGAAVGTSVFLFAGGIVGCEFNLNLANLPDGVNNAIIRAGFGDVPGADQVDGTFFEQDFATYGNNNWRGKTASNNVRSFIDLGVAPVVATWTTLRLDLNSDATLVTFKVDGITKGTLTTNIPIGAGRQTGGFLFQFLKQLGAGAVSLRTDYHEVTQTFLSAR